MSIDLKIMIRPNGDQCDLEVTGWPSPANRSVFPRIKPVLTNGDLTALRGGDAPANLVSQLTAGVSRWILGNDFTVLLQTALNSDSEPLRLIFDAGDPGRFPEFNDLPVEMVVLPGGLVPLILHQRVDSIVHLLDKVGGPSSRAISRDWPLRVLIIRSNPGDLGSAVPRALPLRDEILRLSPFVEVDVLTRESGSGAKGLPTLSGFLAQLESSNYDILIYMGHGDLDTAHGGSSPIGVLKLENSDGSASDNGLNARKLATALHEWPVPVVLLVGCLTAAEMSAEVRQTIDPEIPRWMRGSQGVAQVLINSESGVQAAVGMRSRIESSDATYFLGGFFQSLLRDKPGHIDAAIRAGRRELHLRGVGEGYAWSSPMVFRTLETEPIFSFMTKMPQCPETEKQDAFRAILWEQLAQLPLSGREPDRVGPLLMLLRELEEGLARLADPGVVRLVPRRLELLPNQQGDLDVSLGGPLNACELQGRLVAESSEAAIVALTSSPELLNQGFKAFWHRDEPNQVSFLIRSTDGPRDLPFGGVPLFRVRVAVGSSAGVVCPIRAEDLKSSPLKPICPGHDAIIVPRA